ncbi:MAG: Mce-associated rane protein [Mycobacterium sp.]|nr:Mce-associated rane protein [Mycobacterium sp.]
MTTTRARRATWWTLIVGLVLAIAATAALGGWQAVKGRKLDNAVSAAARQTVLDTSRSTAVKLLSYKPDTVEADLNAAASLLTGNFRESYSKLTHDVVIPGAKQKNITAVAQVPAAGVESLTTDKASTIVFVNQTVTVPPDAPTNTASSIRVGLRKINGAWFIDAFDPI